MLGLVYALPHTLTVQIAATSDRQKSHAPPHPADEISGGTKVNGDGRRPSTQSWRGSDGRTRRLSAGGCPLDAEAFAELPTDRLKICNGRINVTWVPWRSRRSKGQLLTCRAHCTQGCWVCVARARGASVGGGGGCCDGLPQCIEPPYVAMQ